MQLIKLTDEQLKNISTPLTLQRAENYVGKFYDCSVDGAELVGKIRGNHGTYTVKLNIDTDPLGYYCGCETSKSQFCKHAAGLGLTYIYTPWAFATNQKLERSKIKDFDDLKFYVKTTSLKELIEELTEAGTGTAQLADAAGISMQQLLAVIKDDASGKSHLLTDPLKITCMYLLDKK